MEEGGRGRGAFTTLCAFWSFNEDQGTRVAGALGEPQPHGEASSGASLGISKRNEMDAPAPKPKTTQRLSQRFKCYIFINE